ncbi:MAG: triose-phosphate isomerase [Acidobacteriaceae bacterium]|nr:triose-phosphate isomerase [Acidobacteriaceae bacterium]
MRKPLMAGNWKMFKTPEESIDYLAAFLPLVADHERDEIVLFPTLTALSEVVSALRNTRVAAGTQTMHWLAEGPYTGQTSVMMLSKIGCRFVLLGHSEQRSFLGETDGSINLKLQAALAHGFVPLLCLGETLAQRENGETEAVLRKQLRGAVAGLTSSQAETMVIAYEPIWAIGTGHTAAPDLAGWTHSLIRSELALLFGQTTASAIRILYGGSVTPHNIEQLMAEPEIDGALVGGASLTPESFSRIVHYGQPA